MSTPNTSSCSHTSLRPPCASALQRAGLSALKVPIFSHNPSSNWGHLEQRGFLAGWTALWQAASGEGGHSGQRSAAPLQLQNANLAPTHPAPRDHLPPTPHTTLETMVPTQTLQSSKQSARLGASPPPPPSSSVLPAPLCGVPLMSRVQTFLEEPCARTVIKIWWSTFIVSLLSPNNQNCQDSPGVGERKPQNSKEKCILNSHKKTKTLRNQECQVENHPFLHFLIGL